jgi:hypothetical protein
MKFLVLLLALSMIGFSVAASQSGNNSAQNRETQSELKIISAELRIFPNPVTGNTLKVSALKDISSVQLNNIVGQKSEIETTRLTSGSIEVVLKNKKKGVYLITVNFDDHSKEVRRIIIN